MRNFGCPIKKKGTPISLLKEQRQLSSCQLGKASAGLPNLVSVAPKVVSWRALPVEKMRVGVNNPRHVPPRILEALSIRHGLG